MGTFYTWEEARSQYATGTYRLPTDAEFQELLDNCDVTQPTRGTLVFTSRITNNSITLPATGSYNDINHNGEYTYYPYYHTDMNLRGGSYYWSSNGADGEGHRLRWSYNEGYPDDLESPAVVGGGQIWFRYPIRLVKAN